MKSLYAYLIYSKNFAATNVAKFSQIFMIVVISIIRVNWWNSWQNYSRRRFTNTLKQ